MEEQDQSEKNVKRKRNFRCGVNTCNITSTTHPQYSFYSLPKDPIRTALWLKKMQQPMDANTPKLYVCARHFEEKYINLNVSRQRLKKTALPTRFLPDDPQDSDGMNDRDEASLSYNNSPVEDIDTCLVPVKVEQIDNNPSTSSTEINETQRKRTLSEIFQNEVPSKIVKIKEENDCLTVFVDEDKEGGHHEDEIVANQHIYDIKFDNILELKKKKKSKYSNEFKMFALDLYFKCPNAYRLLQTTFTLPRISTIYRVCIPKTSVLDEGVIRALGIKVNDMTPAQKQAVVCIGTMRVSPTIEYDAVNDTIFGFHELNGVQTLDPAGYVLLVVVRGLFHDWKQVVAFTFLNNCRTYKYINFFVDKVIRKLFEIGLEVRILLSDLESDSLVAAKERGVDVKDPFFFVNTKKIYFMYDTLHLMRNVRDNFMSNILTFKHCKLAKWSYVMSCYEHDSKKHLLRLAPHLTKDHIKPKKDARDNLKCTAELFSRRTAAAISAYIDLEVIARAAKETVQFILTMSKLKDMLNFSTKYPPEDRKAVFTGETSQVDFLVSILSLFFDIRLSNLSVSESTKTTDISIFKEGFRLTINSLLLLYGALKTEDCWLPIVGLSHDCLTDFFDKVYQRHGHQPTVQKVVMCITKLPIFNVFQYFPKKKVAGEMELFLSRAKSVHAIKMYDEELTELYVDKCAQASSEFPTIALPDENKVQHLALYLLYKGYQEHSNCEAMENYVCRKDIIENSESGLQLGHEICENKINLVPLQFVNFLVVLELKFKEYFKEHRMPWTMAGLQSLTSDVTFEMPCGCFPIDFIKQLYFRFRLYCVLKYNNALFSQENSNHVFVINDL
ncbi:unnamed protein product [Arctia plantaginis]|uniref:THAP-type domain-containing protein n=1 Tax=Arctia plantaginis TaxID=874455 RepID=A0A8S1B4K0_ARCPL|nr:unnamed protein product [Arctia plantaginis]